MSIVLGTVRKKKLQEVEGKSRLHSEFQNRIEKKRKQEKRNSKENNN